ncbi:MAG: multiheme c-type cytochrome [Aeoliella sp.]
MSHPPHRSGFSRGQFLMTTLAILGGTTWAAFALSGDSSTDRSTETTLRFGAARTVESTGDGPRFEGRFVAKLATEGPAFRLAAGGKSQVDPIEANGTIFVDWPKPDVALLFTGEQMGFLEPCGCAGLENQKGGFKRRFTLMKELRDDGWPIVAMDAGGLIRRYGPQAQIKLHWSYDGLRQMGYAAVGFGDKDLRLDVLSEAANLTPNPIVSANIGLVDFDAGFTQRFRVVESGGYRIGMTTVMGTKETEAVAEMRDLVTLPPVEAIAQVLPELEAQECDELVLLVYGDVDETRALAEQFPQFGWVVAGKGGDEPPHKAIPLAGGKTQLIEVGHKGMYAVVVGLYKQGEPRTRYQKVPLDHRFDDALEMQDLLVQYQDQLKTLVTSDLGFTPLTGKPASAPGGGFAGSEICADCHSTACEIFMNSPHAHATQTLVDLDPPRHYDPECLSCHVTGWNPQGYVPYATGYTNLEATAHLTTNGCENCHGAALSHADAELGNIDATEAQIEDLRTALRMKIGENEGNLDGQETGKVVDNCLECHDLDNSPDFDFQEYWNREDKPVKHYGKD